jgi:type IV pilus assembly protein PilX
MSQVMKKPYLKQLCYFKKLGYQMQTGKQAGFVLFIALIALVVMSLAAVALIRSVDTNSQVTANLAYRQSATLSSSYGLEAVAQTIGKKAKGYEISDDATNGFYASCDKFDTNSTTNLCGGEKLTLDASWVPGTKSAYADNLPGITAGKDAYGNTVQYIVERMCKSTGTGDKDRCMLTGASSDNSSHVSTGSATGGKSNPNETVDQPIYRITVRIAGPKNTANYIQAFFS